MYTPCVTHPTILYQLSQHDYDVRVLLPHHPPEVIKRRREGPLCCYVCSPHPETLHVQRKKAIKTFKIKKKIFFKVDK